MTATPPSVETARPPSVRRWIKSSFRPAELEELRRAKTPEIAAQRNAALQVEHLMKHPLVAERIADGTLRVTAWFYDIGAGEILEYDRSDGEFHPLGSRTSPPGVPPNPSVPTPNKT